MSLFYLGGYKFRLPAQIDASGWILVWNSPARCSSASTSFLFFLFLCHKEIKTLNRLHEHKKGKEEQETGTWILWGGSAVGRLFIFFISGSENFGAGPILFFKLFCLLFLETLGLPMALVFVCVYIPVQMHVHTHTQRSRERAAKRREARKDKKKIRNNQNESGRLKDQTNRRRPSGN